MREIISALKVESSQTWFLTFGDSNKNKLVFCFQIMFGEMGLLKIIQSLMGCSKQFSWSKITRPTSGAFQGRSILSKITSEEKSVLESLHTISLSGKSKWEIRLLKIM